MSCILPRLGCSGQPLAIREWSPDFHYSITERKSASGRATQYALAITRTACISGSTPVSTVSTMRPASSVAEARGTGTGLEIRTRNRRRLLCGSPSVPSRPEDDRADRGPHHNLGYWASSGGGTYTPILYARALATTGKSTISRILSSACMSHSLPSGSWGGLDDQDPQTRSARAWSTARSMRPPSACARTR